MKFMSLVCLMMASAQAFAQTTVAEVASVVDGDTLYAVVNGSSIKVRIASIDAPETGHGHDKPGQPFSRAATDELNALFGPAPRQVTLTCYELDRYGRSVCNVASKRGVDVGTHLVTKGLAWANTASKGRYLRNVDLMALQQKAQEKRLGVWSSPSPVPPWEWRTVCWKDRQCPN